MTYPLPKNFARWHPTSAEPYGPIPVQTSTYAQQNPNNTVIVTYNGQPYKQILSNSSGVHMIPTSSSSSWGNSSGQASTFTIQPRNSLWVNMNGPIVYPMNQSIPSPFHQSYIDAYAGKTGTYMY
jgi:hypothetical protein